MSNLLFFIIFVSSLFQVKAQTDTLIVQLGFEEQPLTYIWSNGDTSTKQFRLTVNLTLNNVSLTTLTTSVPIQINCLKSSQDDSFAGINFSPASVNTVISNPNPILISFNIFKAGQAPNVQCTGTLTGIFPTQVLNGVTVNQIKIIPISKILNVLPPPTISFDSSSIFISPFQLVTLPATLTFKIRFRDIITSNSVTLTCTPTNLNAIAPIANVIVSTGVQVASVSYSVLVNTVSTSIRCTANSNGGTQYVAATAFATSVFQVIPTKATIDASQFSDSTFGSAFNIPISIVPQVPASSSGVTFQCAIKSFNTFSDYTAFQSNYFCPIYLNSLSTTTTSSASSSSTASPTTTFNYGSYNNIPFDWYIYDNSLGYVKSVLLKFDGSTRTNTLQIMRYPNTLIETQTKNYLALYCCDVTTNQPTTTTTSTTTLNATPRVRVAVISGQANYTNTNINPSTSPFGSLYNAIFFTTLLKTSAQSSTSVTNPKQFPTLLNPAYQDIAKCVCNLTPDLCDNNCCCDTDCTTNDLQVFSKCTTLPTTYTIDKEVDYWNCSNKNLEREDWFPILCIQSITSVIMGKYYSTTILKPIEAVEYSSNYRNLFLLSYNYRSVYQIDPYVALSSSTQISTYKSGGPLCFNDASTYMNGTCIKTVYYKQNSVDDPNIYLPNTGVLTFPSPLHNKRCLPDSPVKYLYNVPKSFCESAIDDKLCTSTNLFDANNYLYSTLISQTLSNFAKTPQVLKTPNSVNNLAQTYTEYWRCTSYDSFADDTFLNQQLQAQSVDPVDSCKSCRTNSLIFDKTASSSCDQTNSSLNNITIPGVSSDYSYNNYAPACTLVSLTSTPSAPTVANNECQNAVTQVKYVIFWKDQTIVRVLTRVVTTNVPLSTTNKKLKQSFQLTWYPYSESELALITTVSDFEGYLIKQQTLQNMLSGYQGYFINKPIISGKFISGLMDTRYDYRFSSFLVNTDGLCGKNTLRRPVKFGVNTTSSCQVSVNINDFHCDCLRKLVFDRINAYFAPSDYISKNGNVLSYTHIGLEWLTVTRKNVDKIVYGSYNYTNILSDKNCTNIPSGITVWFIYSEVGKARGQPSNEILATYVNYTFSNWQYRCKDPVNGCNTNKFNIEFNTKFVDLTNRDATALKKCNYSGSCIEDLLWLWTSRYEGEDIIYLYTVNLSLAFGFVSFVIVYFMIIGLVCPC